MIISQVIHPDDERILDAQGISKQFLNYFQSLDKSVGESALGRDQTISGHVRKSLDVAAQHARTVDEQGGYSKIAHGVGTLCSLFPGQFASFG